jgi:Arc/MetJ-type ribon-helix-helix transcriptional regulator
MPTITVKLDKQRAKLLTQWARRRKVTKSDVIRELIDRVEKTETAGDLLVWVETNEGKGLGLRQRTK